MEKVNFMIIRKAISDCPECDEEDSQDLGDNDECLGMQIVCLYCGCNYVLDEVYYQ